MDEEKLCRGRLGRRRSLVFFFFWFYLRSCTYTNTRRRRMSYDCNYYFFSQRQTIGGVTTTHCRVVYSGEVNRMKRSYSSTHNTYNTQVKCTHYHWGVQKRSGTSFLFCFVLMFLSWTTATGFNRKLCLILIHFFCGRPPSDRYCYVVLVMHNRPDVEVFLLVRHEEMNDTHTHRERNMGEERRA